MKNKIKIAYVITSLATGGAEMVVSQLAKELNSGGFQIRIITMLKNDGIPRQIVKNLNIELIELDYKFKFNPKLIWEIRKYTKGFDIIHTHNYAAQLLAIFSRTNGKLVTTEHSTINNRRRHFLYKIPDYFMYGAYSSIICISEGVKASLNQWMPSTVHKTKVIENGIDVDRFIDAKGMNLKVQLNIPDESKIIVCVGRFEQVKNHASLLMALKEVNRGIHLVLVGDGIMRNQLEEYVIKNGLEGQVHFLGIRNDVEIILKACDAFILVSYNEGFGLVCVEAMAAGLPIIISDVEGMNQFINNNDIGILVDPNNIEEIASAINALLYVRDDLDRVKELAISKARLYSTSKMCEQHIKRYCKMLDL